MGVEVDFSKHKKHKYIPKVHIYIYMEFELVQRIQDVVEYVCTVMI